MQESYLCLKIFLIFFTSVLSFQFQKFRSQKSNIYTRCISLSAKLTEGYTDLSKLEFPDDLSNEWELDCYSRPVVDVGGKKLWELMITDSRSKFRYIQPIPSNLVNSRNVRNMVEELVDASPVRPKKIRFFRNQMYNMINIALQPLDVDVKPSKCTHNLFSWLREREKNIYPNMSGYNSQLKQATILDFEISQPDRLPDILKSESYSFNALPAEVFWNNEVNEKTINRGVLCPITDMPKEGWINGISLFSKRAPSVAAWMEGVEISSIKADLLTRELLLNFDLNGQYMIAPLLDAQKQEALIFETNKPKANGYHFLSIRTSPEAEEVEGFWLLRQYDESF